MNTFIENNFIDLNSIELNSLNGGGWLSVVGGGLIIAGGIVTGGAIPITVGVIGGLGTMFSGM